MPSQAAPETSPTLSHYHAAEAALAATATAQLGSALASVDWSSPDIGAVVSTLYGSLIQGYRRASATLMLQMYGDLRSQADVGGRAPNVLAPDADPEWIAAKVSNAFKISERAAKEAVQSMHELKPTQVPEVEDIDISGAYVIENVVTKRLEDSVQRMVASGGRETVVANVEADPAKPMGWARVPTSDHPCAFCVVMASRGFRVKKVRHYGIRTRAPYLSKQSALTVSNKVRLGIGRGNTKPAIARGVQQTGHGSQELGEKYHDHCSCIAVPVFKRLPPSVDDYEEMYEKARANAGKGDLKSILASMRQIYNVH